jgi:hypothetical protein
MSEACPEKLKASLDRMEAALLTNKMRPSSETNPVATKAIVERRKPRNEDNVATIRSYEDQYIDQSIVLQGHRRFKKRPKETVGSSVSWPPPTEERNAVLCQHCGKDKFVKDQAGKLL